jgi:hypothetical protein
LRSPDDGSRPDRWVSRRGFVSGYIFVANSSGLAGGGSTHAWMQAYLPGAGSIDFCPTNNIIGDRNLIRVAVA